MNGEHGRERPSSGKAVSWNDLPAELVACIVSELDPASRTSFASTSTHSFWDIMLAKGAHYKVTSSAQLPRLAGSISTYPRSHSYFTGTIELATREEIATREGVAMDAVDACTLAGVLNSAWSIDLVTTCFRSSVLRPYINSIVLQDSHFDGLIRIPSDMVRLRKIDGCRCESRPAANWLPKSLRANVEELVGFRLLHRVPPDMSNLQRINVSSCTNLVSDWLPKSSRAKVEEIIATMDDVFLRIPADLINLKKLNVSGSKNLAPIWLPKSSRGRIQELNISETNLKQIPPGLSCLETLDVTGCPLCGNWLPPSSKHSLSSLITGGSEPYLPSRMTLQDINGQEVRPIAAEILYRCGAASPSDLFETAHEIAHARWEEREMRRMYGNNWWK